MQHPFRLSLRNHKLLPWSFHIGYTDQSPFSVWDEYEKALIIAGHFGGWPPQQRIKDHRESREALFACGQPCRRKRLKRQTDGGSLEEEKESSKSQ